MKVKSAILLFFTLLCTTCFAQVSGLVGLPPGFDYFYQVSKKDSIDDVRLRVQYHVTYKDAKEDADMTEDLQALDIGSRMSKYYSDAMVYCYEHLPLDLREREDKTEALQTAISQHAKYKGNVGVIYRNHPEQGNLFCYRSVEIEGITYSAYQEKYSYTEAIPQPDWTLEEGDTTICNYACQRATATFRGRTWRVWYALDLPYEEGPWKLGGLPGLILKAEDAAGEYDFTAIEIFKPKDRCIKKPDKKGYKKGSEKKIQASISACYKNLAGYIRMTEGDQSLDTMEQIGIKVNAEPRTPCFLEQEQLK